MHNVSPSSLSPDAVVHPLASTLAHAGMVKPSWPFDARALIVGDLGDSTYRVESFSESLDLVRRVEKSHQIVTLVVMDLRTPQLTDPQLVFTARLVNVSDETQSLEADMPMGSRHIPKGMTLRGSVQLNGVMITFECETLGTQPSTDQRAGVLRARLPFRLYRIQRRDSFRVPVAPSAGVLVSLAPGHRALEGLRAMDLSCGGVSVVVCAPLDTVHQGKRFASAAIRLYAPPDGTVFQIGMCVRHLRLMPPGLSQLLSLSVGGAGISEQERLRAGIAVRQSLQLKSIPHQLPETHTTTDAGGAAVSTQKSEWVQLGIEFERMPMAMERELAKRVNELAVNLVAGT